MAPVGAVASRLVNVRSVDTALVDLDGTVYANGRLVPGAVYALGFLRQAGIALRFLTNRDSLPPGVIRADLAAMGLEVAPWELFTPVLAAQRYLEEQRDVRALLMVSSTVRTAFERFTGKGPVTHVVVGDCRDTLDYALLDHAFRAVRGGAELVALQRGRYFVRSNGEHLGTGGIVAALEYSANITAKVVGKPSKDFLALAAASTGTDVSRCVVIGDDATTDVAGGVALGARTVQVRTGRYAEQQGEDGLPCAEAVIDSIADLPALLFDWDSRTV
jgi:HAD superfamily hydrolase (TIGR01458 family)